MNFLELQNEVISDRFDEGRRDSIKSWINYRYGRIWAAADWTFKLQTDLLSVDQGSQNISRGTRGDILSISDGTYGTGFDPMYAYRPEEFFDKSVQTAARPIGYTIIGDLIWFNAPLDVTRSYRVMSETKFVLLSADSDIPAIPEEFHYMLVHAAASEGLLKENDPSWQGEEQQYEAALDGMKEEYLSNAVYYDHLPSWP